MLPLATTSWDEKEIEALHSVIDSGRFSMGEHVRSFEDRFASYVGSKYCVMVNSGSSANLLAVAAMFYRKSNSLKAGDEVIVPAVSWSTTYFPLYQYGLKIKFVDIDKETLNLDLEKLEDAISENTKAIFSVNLLGNPVDYEKMTKIIAGRDIVILEDNCESLGASLHGKQAGTFGLMGTFSTYFSHHISTMEGGMVVTDDEECYHIMLSLRSHGWTRNLPETNRVCDKTSSEFHESFRFVLPGYNIRPLEMAGALGLQQLEKLDGIIAARRKNAETFKAVFAEIPQLSIQKETGESSWFGFAIILNLDTVERDNLVSSLNSQGVETRPVVAGNFTRNPVIKYFDYTIHDSLEHSDHITDCGFFIGNHNDDISRELSVVAEFIKEEIKGRI